MDVLKIKRFLDGYENGYGYGYGVEAGNGNGLGKGLINGSELGRGDGSGHRDGSGIKIINGYNVYSTDDTPTIFTHIHGNVAKGYILEHNVILKPCYIVKGNGYFVHDETLRKAQRALEEKNW